MFRYEYFPENHASNGLTKEYMIITIYSHNGGTGKTTIAITLAVFLQQVYKKDIELCTLHDNSQSYEYIKSIVAENNTFDSAESYPVHEISNINDIRKDTNSKGITIIDMNSPADLAIIENSDLVLLPVTNNKIDLIPIFKNEFLDWNKSYIAFNCVPVKFQNEKVSKVFLEKIKKLEKQYEKSVKYAPFIYENHNLRHTDSLPISLKEIDKCRPFVEFIAAKLNLSLVPETK